MLRLFIEGEELDINASFSHQITYAVDDLQNLDSKTTAFSKTIVLPGTSNNNRLLGNIFEFGNSNFTNDGIANVGYNFNASRSAKMKFEMNGLQIMKGTLRLLEIIIDGQNIEYEIALIGELGGFIAKLGNKKLENIDFGNYNHIYSLTNIQDSWDNANAGEGYYYPLIDYGVASVNKIDYDYRTFRPSLFVREFIDRIITENGYTWESNFLNTNFFKRLVIPHNQKKLNTYKTKGLQLNSQSFPQTLITYYDWRTSDITSNATYLGSFTTDGIKFTWPGSSNVFNINFNTLFRFFVPNSNHYTGGIIPYITFGSNTLNFKIRIIKTSGGIDSIIYQTNTYNLSKTNSASPTATSFVNCQVNFNTQITLSTGDSIKFDIIMNGNRWIYSIIGGGSWMKSEYNTFANSLSCNTTIDSPIPILLPIELGDELVINESIPKNIFQKDFFTSILKMFYLMVTEDKFKPRHLVIEPWVDFYDKDRTTYLDWSLKVDRSEPIKIKPMAELNARYYQLSYKSDTDWKNEAYKKLYNENYGDRIYDNGYEFAKDTDKTEVIFSPTVLIGFANTDKVVSSIYKWTNGVEDFIDSNIRILQAAKLTGYADWHIRNNGTNISSTLNVFPYAGHLDNPDAPNADLNFGVPRELYFTLVSGALSNNLFNSYYSSYLAEITDKDSRVITVKMKFTEQEIYNLDFGKYILIDSVLYRLQKIIDYTPGELCKVELLRVISTNYQ